MSRDKVRIGVIGCGQIANGGHFPHYAGRGDVEVVAACDIRRDRLDAACEQYRIPHRYSDLHKLLERDDIDAVDICLHNNYHASAAIAALRAGKHVYCEKPIAGSWADGKAMVDAADACGRKLHVQLNMLYTPEARGAKRLIDGGKLGRLYHMRSVGYRRRGRPYIDGYGAIEFAKRSIAGGGALFDMGVYYISQLLYLAGMPRAERICGRVYREMTNAYPDRVRESGFDVEELGTGFVSFAGGLTLDILESWAVHMDHTGSSCIFGADGGLRLNPLSYFTTTCDLELDATVDMGGYEGRRQLIHGDAAEDERTAVGHWVAALAGRCQLMPTARLALDTMLIQEGIYMSSARGQEVTAEEVRAGSVSTAIPL